MFLQVRTEIQISKERKDNSLGNTPIRYDKENTKNPIARILYKHFKQSILELIPRSSMCHALEIGCGCGEILNYIKSEISMKYIGVDINEKIIKEAKSNYSGIDFYVADGSDLPFEDSSFDIVLLLEVLEHIPNVEDMINEVKRVSKHYSIFSVPREPLWRFLNVMRFSHLKNFGNTPGHINHWNSRNFKRLLSKHFETIEIAKPMPWTIILCKKK
jgi:ubiquinone/menaquinone biosynthesis C-methylase UbiE|tara:strand:+ start:6359 stop:7006 length:648 start_codon:yes stop_codon:yes gene_type:complete